jgi:signal transduction histidine kinase
MSVFHKIFLSFWAALILAIVLSAVVLPFSDRDRFHALMDAEYANALAADGEAALDMVQHGEVDKAAAFLNSKAHHKQEFIFDSEGNEVTHRPVPTSLRTAFDAGELRNNTVQHHGTTVVRAVDIHGDTGNYTLIAQFPEPRRLRPDPVDTAIRLAALVLTSGFMCWLLARYLTSPLIKLRTATHKLAAGDLSARAEMANECRKDEVAELVNDFNRMAERLQTLMSAQGRLISDISHELRSPLARLSIASGILRQRSGSQPNPTLDRVERETERLNKLIEQVLTISTLESGSVEVEKSTLDLCEIAREVSEDASFEAQNCDCRVSVDIDGPCFVHGNRSLLRSAIENVVRNALRYSPRGSSIELTMRPLEGGETRLAMLEIRDHGPGLPDSELDNIFRPFYRVTDDRDRLTGGAGLGLAICERAIRLHGGSIRAFNAGGGGLVIEISVPLADSEPRFEEASYTEVGTKAGNPSKQ